MSGLLPEAQERPGRQEENKGAAREVKAKVSRKLPAGSWPGYQWASPGLRQGKESSNREAQTRGDLPRKASIPGPTGGIQSKTPRRPESRASFPTLPPDNVCTPGEGREVQEGSPQPSQREWPTRGGPAPAPNSISSRGRRWWPGTLTSSGLGWEGLLGYSGVSLGFVRGWPPGGPSCRAPGGEGGPGASPAETICPWP